MIKKFLLMTLFTSAVLPFTANAQLKYQEGADYKVLSNPIEVTDTPKVVEFFWFGCGHCNHIRPEVNEWLEKEIPEGIEFEFIPANLEADRWRLPAHAYYTMEMLEVDLFDAYFDAVFNDRNYGLLASEDVIKKFFVKNGVEAEAFDKAWNSLEVKQKLQRARDLFEKSGLRGVPAFIVNGKYVVNVKGNDKAAYDRMFDIIETLAQ